MVIEGNHWFLSNDLVVTLGFDLRGGVGKYLQALDMCEKVVATSKSIPDLFGGYFWWVA